jgi:hypothetical protein
MLTYIDSVIYEDCAVSEQWLTVKSLTRYAVLNKRVFLLRQSGSSLPAEGSLFEDIFFSSRCHLQIAISIN